MTVERQKENLSVDKKAVVARILCCPDCESELSSTLKCPSCSRSFMPQEDGIISALPARMEAVSQNKDSIKKVIDTSGPGQHGETIVLYEKAFHDEQAAYYDKLFANPLPLSEYYKRLVRHQIYSYIRRQQQRCVVDLCCGTGKSSMALVERGLLVVGLDVSREMLRVYRQKCKENANLILIHADASHPPLRKGSCDAITMIGGLHHIQERAECVASCCDALAANGLFILHEPLQTGKTSKIAVLLENFYALTDPGRVWAAVTGSVVKGPGLGAEGGGAPKFRFLSL